ncbi:MAG: SPFH domain-containing protein [Pirellulales bacterium]|nr:SPFH domain-containing protein [Pirellulales bacterium]
METHTPQRTIDERPATTLPGLPAFLAMIVWPLVAAWFIVSSVMAIDRQNHATFGQIALLVIVGLVSVVWFICWNGFFIVQPNYAEVLVLFGRYVGSVKRDGWYFTNPLVTKSKTSLRVRNFQSEQLKVNDLDGNPIEIAAVVVWKVVDTARATFDVENYEKFVEVQSETAIRRLASKYPYDQGEHPGAHSLRGSADEVGHDLCIELQARLDVAGIEVVESRLSHLAYSPEIAGAMLQRQQAAAVIAARQRIVEGAVSMVEMALAMLEEKKVIELNTAQKAEMVASLLVVLTSDRGAQPVLPTGGHMK